VTRRTGASSISSTGSTTRESLKRSSFAGSRRQKRSRRNWHRQAHRLNRKSRHRGQVQAPLTGLVGEGAGSPILLFFQRLSARSAA
jgi:hypothetical protein